MPLEELGDDIKLNCKVAGKQVGIRKAGFQPKTLLMD